MVQSIDVPDLALAAVPGEVSSVILNAQVWCEFDQTGTLLSGTSSQKSGRLKEMRLLLRLGSWATVGIGHMKPTSF